MSNRDLHPLLKRVHKGIVGVKTELQTLVGEVKKIHETVKDGVETIVDAINDVTQAQAEIKLIDEMTEVHSLEPQIDAEQQTIEEEREELEETLETIGDRYEEKHEDLDRTAEERIRSVGEHIYEIDEDEFEASVENPFVEHVTGTWAELREHNHRAQSTREGALRRAIALATDAIEGFTDRRNRLLADIDDHRTDLDLDVDEPTVLQVPFWEIEVQTVDGTRTEVVGPAELQGTQTRDSWTAGTVRPRDGFERTLHSASERPPASVGEHGIDRSDLVRSMETYGDEKLGGTVSYADAYDSALADDFSVEIQR